MVTLAPAPQPTDQGMCAECAVTWWLWSVDGLRWALDDGGPAILEAPAIQETLNGILGMMHPELARVQWARLLTQWDLPWPKGWERPADHRR